MQAMKEISQWNNRICSLGKWPPNSNADQMKTNPVNKAFITTTNDVIVPNSQDSTYSSSLYSQDSTYSSSLSIIARFDILIFALLSNRETQHTRLRSHREIRYTHLRSQMARLGILVLALIREIRHTHRHSYRETQLVFGPTHRCYFWLRDWVQQNSLSIISWENRT